MAMNPTLPSLSLPAGAVAIPLARAIADFDPQVSHPPYVWVQGEISDLRRAASGHQYFTLSEGATEIPCVLWEKVARGIAIRVEDSLAVAVHGWIQTHPQRGHLELDVRDLIVQGPQGPRQTAVDELKAKLAAEGLLDPARKRGLPVRPRCIGVVTSPTGNVIHDITRILQRRAPGVQTQLAPTRVSGDGAAAEIAAAVRSLSASGTASPIILARGGGSRSDLAPFNSEAVARAIAECAVPVISAIGHEPDVTIADLVADVRCATPSEAAELAVPDLAAAGVAMEVAAGHGMAELRLQIGNTSVLVRLPVSPSAPDQP